jgi:quinate dehydrogenase (quinone)
MPAPKDHSSLFARVWFLLLGAVIIAAGLFLAGGGSYLVSLGGSWYFLIAGIALLVSGILTILRRPAGPWIFWLIFVATIPWALWEVGLEFWPLVSRLFALAVATLLVTLSYPALLRSRAPAASAKWAYAIAAPLGVGIVAATISAFFPKSAIEATETAGAVVPVATSAEQKEWRDWGNTTAGTRFAALDQINRDNIGQLRVAWTARTGDIAESDGSGAEDQNTPLQVGDTLFVCTAYSKVIALDVDTGAERWRYDPEAASPNWQRCRGLGYHGASAGAVPAATAQEKPPPQPACVRRLFLPTIDARLIAISADTGEPCVDFGANGTVDLTVGMGEVKPGYYHQTSAPLVAGDLVVVGGRVADNYSTGEPPGVVRAFNVLSGELVWAWDPGNPAVTRLPPPGQTYTRGTPNVWSTMSYDARLGLIYLPTGNATPDLWAGSRTELDDKYSSSVVAVEAATGRVRWSFQGVHHDLWDFDMPAQPVLYDIPDGSGGSEPALIQVTKHGEIFLLNRETGQPIAEVQERPVPQGNMPGERYSPTQPFSIGMPSIGNQILTEADMWGVTPFDQLLCRIQFKRMRHQGVFTPPGLDPTLQFPGAIGGMNWGSVSVDPTISYIFVNDVRLGHTNHMMPHADIPVGASGIEMGVMPQDGTPFGAMRQRFQSQLGIPCQKPPFGTMSAIDLRTRKLVWQVPVGTVHDTGLLGIAVRLPIPLGMPTLGPSLATQSGLLFFAGTLDYYLRAFDSRTGEEIWKARLPVGSQSGPMTYVSPKTDKQYIVITAGGARRSPDRGDYVIAYALP